MTIAYIGIGSNLDDPLEHVTRAVSDLANIEHTRLIKNSRCYQSVPMGPKNQPDFINLVASLETQLPASKLLTSLQEIENAHGRVRTQQRWGPRTLDLDLLLFGSAWMHTEALRLPHPGITDRAFVLYPLQEIAPELVIPGRGHISELVMQCPRLGLTPIECPNG